MLLVLTAGSAAAGLAPNPPGGVYEIRCAPRGGSTLNLPLLPTGGIRSARAQTGPFDWGS